ncbi:MAG: cysteine--tRNA ligase [Asticcacaulis sp.]
MKLHIYDTLKRKSVEFEPRENKPVTLYVCGPTVYSYAHIGNARPVVVFDVLFRLLRRLYGEDRVIYARNITDVDDKINQAAITQGVPIATITEKFADIYNQDMATLGALPPTYQPRATAHMGEMVALIEKLVAENIAYVSEGEVLFDVAAYEASGGQYGALSGRSLSDMIDGARVEVAKNKRNAADFVLWKPSKEGEPVWDGPQGLSGRPGWHIECSAMSESVLGLPIDIHGGGHDLIFPHHTNEIAQSCAAHGHSDPAAYARYWMHNGFLDFGKEKMSKSLGNVKLVHELIKDTPGEVLRWALLSASYRSPLDWNDAVIEQSRNALDKIYGTLLRAKNIVPYKWTDKNQQLQHEEQLLEPFCQDLNTPFAQFTLSIMAKTLNGHLDTNSVDLAASVKADIMFMADILGVLKQDPEAWFKGSASDDLTAQVEALLVERAAARVAKNWPESDRIRDALNALNVEVMDGPNGASWKLKVNA